MASNDPFSSHKVHVHVCSTHVKYCLQWIQWIAYSGYSIAYSELPTVDTALPMVVSDSQGIHEGIVMVIAGYIRMCILRFVQVLYYFDTMKAKNNLYFYLLGEIVVTWKPFWKFSYS